MERFIKGDIVVVPFPYSDLTHAKESPAFVLATLEGNDLILCQITSQSVKDKYSIPLEGPDFDKGTLHKPSHVRPNRIFTADSRIILYRVGYLKRRKVAEIVERAVEIIQS